MADLVVKIRKYSDGKLDRLMIPIASATAIVKGEALSYESGNAVKVDASTDDATFIGISDDDHLANSGATKISCIINCVADAPVQSASYTLGQGLKYNTAGTLEGTTGADLIAWSLEDTATTSVTTLKVLFDVPAIGKLFPAAT